MNLVTPVVVASAMFLVAGCIGPDMPRADNGEDEEAPVATRDLAHDQNSGHTQKRHDVIEDAETWESFWQTHASIQFPQPDAPAVDFETERVVVVLQGERPNGCYHVRITDVQLVGGETRVDITEYVPTEDMACTDQMVQPHHFIAVPADGTDVVFEENEVEGSPSS